MAPSSGLEVQAGLHVLAETAAQSQPGPVLQYHLVFTIFLELEAADSIEVYDRGTVNTAKSVRAQLLLEFKQRVSQSHV